MWEHAIDWLRGSGSWQRQTYALVVGTLYFGVFWLLDHAASLLMVQWLPNTNGSKHFRPNILSLLRRMLLLCATIVLMALDYTPWLLPRLPAQWQQLPMSFWALPMAGLVAMVWKGLEVWIFRRLLPPDLSPSMADFVRMSASSKQTLIGTASYGQLSTRVNQVLYLLTYLHLVMLIYGLRAN